MKILKWTFIGIGIFLLLVVGIAFLLPSTYSVSRTSAPMSATTDTIHRYVGDLNEWPNWGTWWKQYKGISQTLEGDGKSVGSSMTFTNKDDANMTGKLTIVESNPDTGLKLKVEFGQNQDYAMDTVIAYAKAAEGVTVSWTSAGELGNNPFARWAGLFFDSMMGKDFEKNLAAIKEKAEGKASPTP